MNKIILLISLIIPTTVFSQKSDAELEIIEQKLFESKAILNFDNGDLWGYPMWNDSILIIDSKEDIVYSLVNLEGANKISNYLYSIPFKKGELQYTNTVQKFRGGEYVTVNERYTKDDKTIIHELFHKMHFSVTDSLTADAITYLDDFEDRLYLKSEFVALKNALKLMNTNADEDSIKTFINDAFIFRKIRHSKYSEYLKKEIELETVEGLAVYTEIKLSKIPNKYLLAIEEIEKRSKALSLARSFAYATGGAYGIILDYLGIEWRTGLGNRKKYNFLNLYEDFVLKSEINTNEIILKQAQQRNDFKQLEKEETARKEENEKNSKYYNQILFEQPTLRINIKKGYGMTFDMNSIFGLKGKGTVYTNLSGIDIKNEHFGNFKLKSEIGKGGAFIPDDFSFIIFPLPEKIEKNIIKGKSYTIELNKGWKLKKLDKKGNLEIVM